MDWQGIVSLIIVAFAALLLLRSFVGSRKVRKDCSHCALAQTKARITYVQKSENRKHISQN